MIRRRALSLDSMFIFSGPYTFRLIHRVKDRIYWTKVSINTFVSDGHVDAPAFCDCGRGKGAEAGS